MQSFIQHKRTVVTLTNDRRPGPSGARNTGLLAATGDLISFLDDDDEWPPQRIKEMVKVLSDKEDVDAVYSGFKYMYDATGYQRTQVAPLRSDITRALVEDGLFIPLGSLLIRRETVNVVGLFDENLMCGEDTDWVLRLSLKGTMAACQDILLIMHRHGDKHLSTNYDNFIYGFLYLSRKHHALFKRFRRDLSIRYARAARLAIMEKRFSEARYWATKAILAAPWRLGGYVFLAASLFRHSFFDRLLRIKGMK